MAIPIPYTTVSVALFAVSLALIGVAHANVIEATVKIGLCGDGVVDSTEQCDGSNLGGATCGSRGFASGNLRCGLSCEFDTTGCAGTVAQGNGGSRGGGGGRNNPATAPAAPATTPTLGPPSAIEALRSIAKTLVQMMPPPLSMPASIGALLLESPPRPDSGSQNGRRARGSVVVPPPGLQTMVPQRPDTAPALATNPEVLQRALRTIQNLRNMLKKIVPPILNSPSVYENIFRVGALSQLGAVAATLQEAGANITATIRPIPEGGTHDSFTSRAVRFFARAFAWMQF